MMELLLARRGGRSSHIPLPTVKVSGSGGAINCCGFHFLQWQLRGSEFSDLILELQLPAPRVEIAVGQVVEPLDEITGAVARSLSAARTATTKKQERLPAQAKKNKRSSCPDVQAVLEISPRSLGNWSDKKR
jgi:hypothetical protein